MMSWPGRLRWRLARQLVTADQPPRAFVTTNWSLVRAVRTTNAPRRAKALADLCEAYWGPVYTFVRRRGHDADTAADLTQAFFAHVIEKGAFESADPALGRFRTFVLASMKHFVTSQWERDSALKRGGGWTSVAFDPGTLERQYHALRSADLDPEQAFERHWASTVLERAVDRVRARQAAAGRAREFEALAAYLTSDAGPGRPYREVASELGMAEPAVRTAVHRLRERLGEALRGEVAETLDDPAAVDAELRHLLACLGA
jgi:RNA polymerase sigma-70 factor (ECF subfamily)